MKIVIQELDTKKTIKFEDKKEFMKWIYENADEESQLCIDMLNLPNQEPITNINTICKLCLPKGYIRVCDMPISRN